MRNRVQSRSKDLFPKLGRLRLWSIPAPDSCDHHAWECDGQQRSRCPDFSQTSVVACRPASYSKILFSFLRNEELLKNDWSEGLLHATMLNPLLGSSGDPEDLAYIKSMLVLIRLRCVCHLPNRRFSSCGELCCFENLFISTVFLPAQFSPIDCCWRSMICCQWHRTVRIFKKSWLRWNILRIFSIHSTSS